MAVIKPTVDKLNEPTVMLQIRNIAKAVDNNLNAVNDEMVNISNRQDQIEDTVAGFEDQITENTSDIADIKQNIITIEQDITAVENKNNEQDTAISQNETAIENEMVARQNADEVETEARQQADITGASLSVVSGAIQLMLNRALGAINANVTAPFIKTMELIPTSTERAFKLRITYWDNTQYDSNDFVIPAGGGTDVSVTGVTIQDGTTPNSFQVQIELSDGTPISSNDYPFPEAVVNPYPTSVTLALSGNTLSLVIGLSNSETVNGSVDLAPLLNGYVTDAELTQVQSELQEQITNIKPTVTVNEEVDPPTITVAVNGISSTANLPAGGGSSGGWVKLDINNLPTDFTNDDVLMFVSKMYYSKGNTISTTSNLTGIYVSKLQGLNDLAVPIVTYVGMYDPYGVRYIVPSTIYNSTYWNNTDTNTNLMTIFGVSFNFGSNSRTDSNKLTINRSNISNYFHSIYRYVE